MPAFISGQDPAGIFELVEVVGNGTYGQVYKVSPRIVFRSLLHTLRGPQTRPHWSKRASAVCSHLSSVYLTGSSILWKWLVCRNNDSNTPAASGKTYCFQLVVRKKEQFSADWNILSALTNILRTYTPACRASAASFKGPGWGSLPYRNVCFGMSGLWLHEVFRLI